VKIEPIDATSFSCEKRNVEKQHKISTATFFIRTNVS
jgi:hypothetical protein